MSDEGTIHKTLGPLYLHICRGCFTLSKMDTARVCVEFGINLGIVTFGFTFCWDHEVGPNDDYGYVG